MDIRGFTVALKNLTDALNRQSDVTIALEVSRLEAISKVKKSNNYEMDVAVSNLNCLKNKVNLLTRDDKYCNKDIPKS